jgi:parallel beta-helix repeat protein
VTLNSVDGIDFTYASNNNTLSRNLIEANGLNGLELYYSSNNIFSGNNITKNRNLGIFLTSSPSNVFSGNNITANNYAGLDLYYYSSNNVLSGNTFRSNNHYGVAAGYCTGNRIFHNNFLNNTPQASVSNSTDIWDDGYPSGGNYWSNYTGVDQKNGLYQNQTGSDGIGDTPYVINANNTDHYPLMGTFYNYSVYLRVPPFNVTVISNSTITGFTYGIWLENQEHFIKFNVTGKQGSTGFCRVSIPTAMMNDTFTVSVNDTKIPYSLLPCSNATVSYLYFTYTHSTEQVIIVPEFPSFLILPLLMIITLLGTIIFKRKRKAEN